MELQQEFIQYLHLTLFLIFLFNQNQILSKYHLLIHIHVNSHKKYFKFHNPNCKTVNLWFSFLQGYFNITINKFIIYIYNTSEKEERSFFVNQFQFEILQINQRQFLEVINFINFSIITKLIIHAIIINHFHLILIITFHLLKELAMFQ